MGNEKGIFIFTEQIPSRSTDKKDAQRARLVFVLSPPSQPSSHLTPLHINLRPAIRRA
jgi:hypothetical protein